MKEKFIVFILKMNWKKKSIIVITKYCYYFKMALDYMPLLLSHLFNFFLSKPQVPLSSTISNPVICILPTLYIVGCYSPSCKPSGHISPLSELSMSIDSIFEPPSLKLKLSLYHPSQISPKLSQSSLPKPPKLICSPSFQAKPSDIFSH